MAQLIEDALPENEPVDPDGLTEEDFRPHDWALDPLQSLAAGLDDEEEETGLGVTLNIGGLLVSGTMVSSTRWKNHLTMALRGDGSEVSAANLADAYDDIWTRTFRPSSDWRKARQEADLPVPARRWIHLVDATIFSGGSRFNVGTWRAPIAEVKGWSLGVFSQPEGMR